MNILHKATPVLIVDRIEPVLPFWEKLGLEVVTKVPEGSVKDGRLAFAILAGEGVELMYQTLASVTDDLVKSASVKEAFRAGTQQTTLSVEVSRLADIEAKLGHERLVMPKRTTFYGATEIGYTDPAGNIVIFSEHQAASAGS
ncbi:MAG TPA: hypothetical protein VG994_11640 [Steroidobacteraceae bacterium]|nr:hypothetical protein [Steroidobacteraceae bacterium]